ncbi:MAG: SLC13 family permease [Thermofilum sp.]
MEVPEGFRLRVAITLLLGLVTALVATLLELSPVKILSLTVFMTKTYATLLLWSYRLVFAFLGIFFLMALGVLDVPHLIEFAYLDVILFLIAMMTFIGFLEEDGFFDFIVSKVAEATRASFKAMFFVLIIVSAFLAALIDEVTSILIVSALALSISERMQISPFPLLLAIIFATNIGSSATVVGNPVGVMIAFSAGLTFMDFLRWATPISLMAVLLTAAILRFQFRAYIEEGSAKAHKLLGEWQQPSARVNRQRLLLDGVLFTTVMVALALHHPLEEALGLEKNTLLLAIPMLASGIVLLLDPVRGFEAFEKRVEWRTIVFFLLLFASVGTLKYVGLVEDFSAGIMRIAGHSLESLIATFVPLASLMSATLDNVLAVAILVPVVRDLSAYGVPPYPLWWIALFTACYSANFTPVGSTANIVAAGLLERRGHRISFAEWLKASIPVTLATLALSTLLVYVQIPLMPTS